jgi:AmmeMemoRadiSam system protein B
VKIGSAIAELGKKGESHKLFSVIPEAHSREHCIEVQLPFLQEVFGGLEFEVFPILCGEVDFRELAEELLPLLDDETLLVVSSDLSHYLPYEEAKKIDGIANESIPQLDLRRFLDSGDACGKLPILVLMEIAKRRGWTGFFVDYKNSGDTAGDKSAVVGYGCCAFCSTKTR